MKNLLLISLTLCIIYGCNGTLTNKAKSASQKTEPAKQKGSTEGVHIDEHKAIDTMKVMDTLKREVIHYAPDQHMIDSIKAAKTKSKKKGTK